MKFLRIREETRTETSRLRSRMPTLRWLGTRETMLVVTRQGWKLENPEMRSWLQIKVTKVAVCSSTLHQPQTHECFDSLAHSFVPVVNLSFVALYREFSQDFLKNYEYLNVSHDQCVNKTRPRQGKCCYFMGPELFATVKMAMSTKLILYSISTDVI
jgi:hypothetical protein